MSLFMSWRLAKWKCCLGVQAVFSRRLFFYSDTEWSVRHWTRIQPEVLALHIVKWKYMLFRIIDKKKKKKNWELLMSF